MPRSKKIPTAPSVESEAPVIAIPAPILPQPPSPAVLALQESIVSMIQQRAEIRRSIAAAQAQLFEAQAKVQSANSDLLQLEQEVQYRMSVIAQMENRVP